nr:MAG TPA: hypothetical protein [Caudoviricetes sp.]
MSILPIFHHLSNKIKRAFVKKTLAFDKPAKNTERRPKNLSYRTISILQV